MGLLATTFCKTVFLKKKHVTCVPAASARTRAGIAAIIIGGAVLPVTHCVGVNAGLVQGVHHCNYYIHKLKN